MFQKESFRKNIRNNMKINDKIKGKKLQHDITRKAAIISALLIGKINKYEYLTDEEVLPPDQSRLIEQTKFTNSDFGEAFQKQIKKVEDQRRK